ncbi:MAG TPA: DUF5940 domain-containing protein, partial [Acidimicrobiales bacterium]
MKNFPVVSGASQVLAHVPGLARHGSKPGRELAKDADVQRKFLGSLRSFDEAVAYGPNRAYINAFHPRSQSAEGPLGGGTHAETSSASRFTRTGEVMPELEFLGLLALVDDFGLLTLDSGLVERAGAALAEHPLAKRFDLDHLEAAKGDPEAVTAEAGALPLHLGSDTLVGAIRAGQDDDESLSGHVLLENLAGKATASLALLHLLETQGIDPESIEYVIGCGEEAIGDRYQRGGGNMAKAVAQFAGLANASGADLKNFCAAPVPALVVAASLVSSGVFKRVAVIAGGSLPKLGMKFQGHLKNDLPVLEDVLGGAAAIIEADDGGSPIVRLDSVGRHTVSAGGSASQIMEALAVAPLERLGLAMTEVDDYATELHDPGVTEPQGSGNVPERNYKTIAA